MVFPGNNLCLLKYVTANVSIVSHLCLLPLSNFINTFSSKWSYLLATFSKMFWKRLFIDIFKLCLFKKLINSQSVQLCNKPCKPPGELSNKIVLKCRLQVRNYKWKIASNSIMVVQTATLLTGHIAYLIILLKRTWIIVNYFVQYRSKKKNHLSNKVYRELNKKYRRNKKDSLLICTIQTLQESVIIIGSPHAF